MKRLLLLMLFGGAVQVAFSQVPGTISYQGILVDNTGTPVADGSNHDISFNFYTALTGGTLLGTREIKFVTSYKGMFTCVIGNTLNGVGVGTTLNDPVPTIWFTANPQVFVGVQPQDIAPGSELVPRIVLTSVPYAVIAGSMNASGLTGTVANTALDPNLQDLADGSLTGSLVGTGINAANVTTGTLAIANGGTGQSTAANARAALGAGTVTNVTGTAPIAVATGTSTPAISIPKADGGNNGYLSSGDWTIFNGKLGTASTAGGDLSGTFGAANVIKIQSQPVSATTPTNNQILQYNGASWVPTTIATGGGTVTNVTGTAPVSVATGSSTPVISMLPANDIVNGYLTSADHAIFNAKIGPATVFGGDLAGTHSAATVAKLQGQSVSVAVPTANQVLQYIGSTWTPQTIPAGTVTNVTGTAPIVVATGTTTPAISMAAAGTATNGYLTSVDWNNFSGKQGALTATNGLTLAANTLTLGGTLTANTTIGNAGFNINFGGAGNIGFQTPTPVNKLDITGAVGIGAAYSGTSTAPTNGLIVQGNVGIGTPTVTRAFLEQNGTIGATAAIFGGNTTGVSLVANTPNVGFNAYSSAGWKAIAAGFGAHINLDPTLGDLLFETSSASVAANSAYVMNPAIMVKNSGNVGIGTVTPASKLDVEGGAAIGAAYSGTNAAPANGLIVQGQVGIGTNAPGFALDLRSAGGTTLNIGSSAASDVWTYYMNTSAFVGAMGFRSNGNLVLFNSTDDLVIDPTGNVGIGTTTPSSSRRLDVVQPGAGLAAVVGTNSYSGTSDGYGVQGTDATTAYYGYGGFFQGGYMGAYGSATIAGTGIRYGVYGYATGGTSNYGVFGAASTGTAYGVYCSGNGGYTGTWSLISDRKLKTGIEPLGSVLSKVMQLKPSTYQYRTSEFRQMNLASGNQVGLVAQDVEAVFPEVVTNNIHPGSDGTKGQETSFKGIDYIRLVPILVKAVQEQQEQIEALKAQIAQLQK